MKVDLKSAFEMKISKIMNRSTRKGIVRALSIVIDTLKDISF